MGPRQPVLETERLRLITICLDGAPRVRELAGEPAIARTTLLIWHPCREGAAERWMRALNSALASGRGPA